MHQDTHGWLSVPDVLRAMGVVLDDDVVWIVGSKIADAWVLHTGTRPLKDLRRKRTGHGSRCYAIYPPAFRKQMEIIIRSFNPDAGQPNLL